MHAHIVHAHPEPTSYNAALTEAARSELLAHGGAVTVTDLYQSGFDPVERGDHYAERLDSNAFSALAEQRHAYGAGALPPEIRREIDALERADLVLFQFPLWWHGPPAILKGWMDRVFVNGGLYTSRMRYETGYFSGKRALVSVTAGAPRAAFGPGGRGGDFEIMLWPFHYSLHYMGFTVLPPFLSPGVQGHGYRYAADDDAAAQLSRNLSDWRARLSALDDAAPLAFPGWADWDDQGRALDPPA